MKTITDKQKSALAKAESKLPPGWSYQLHDTNDKHERVTVWGVSLYDSSSINALAYVGKNISANCTTGKHASMAKTAINRAASALWHRQPHWASGSY